jgi:hypothetical protein
MTSYPEKFDSEKVDQDEVFYYKDMLHFFLEWPSLRSGSQRKESLHETPCFTISAHLACGLRPL